MAEVVKGHADSLRTLAVSGHPLGVYGNHCRHQITPEHEQLDARQGDMRSPKSLEFVCKSCGSDDVVLYLYSNRSEVDNFLYGEE
jgi:hypothetical protein